VDPTTKANQAAWNAASQKNVREYAERLAEAAAGTTLIGLEREILAPVLRRSPAVVHVQSGNGTDDVPLVQAGARHVVGVDYSEVAVHAAQRRANDLGAACRYVLGEVPRTPLASGSADLVYTGKGGLIWMRDLGAWAAEIARLLRPGGHLFVYDAHPMVILWSWDEDRPRIREDRDYFASSHVNDTFPGFGAVQWQWGLGDIVTTLAGAGLEVLHLGEYAEPFYRWGGVSAAAWAGRLPNAFSLLARLPG
jgi:SAM-dependent methyltransferase